jgi:hypothetical protein
VGSDCANLWLGYYYCVANTDVQPMPDIVSTCTEYYLVQSVDSFYSIEQDYSITSTDFYTWNPAVGDDLLHYGWGIMFVLELPDSESGREVGFAG